MKAINNHKIRSAIILFLFIILLGRYQYKMPKRNFADFHVYYYTAQKLLDKENIYDDNAYRKDKVANFKYPPVMGVMFYPLGLLGENAAAIIWFTLNFLLIILFFYWSSRIVFDEDLDNRARNWIYFLSSLFTLRYFGQNFDEGQVNFLMMVTLILSLFLLKKEKRFYSGFTLCFSSLVKYMSLLFVPYFFVKKKFKVLFHFLSTVLLLSLAPALFLGFRYNLFLQKAFFPFLCKTSLDVNSITTHENQSLIAMMFRYFSDLGRYKINILSLNNLQLYLLIAISYTILYLIALWPTSRFKKSNQRLEPINYSMLFICIALFNPNAWIHAFISLLFPFLTCLYYLFKVNHKDKVVWVMVAVGFLLGSWPESLFLPSIKDSLDIYSLLTIGSIILYFALAKIKFFPFKSFENNE